MAKSNLERKGFVWLILKEFRIELRRKLGRNAAYWVACWIKDNQLSNRTQASLTRNSGAKDGLSSLYQLAIRTKPYWHAHKSTWAEQFFSWGSLFPCVKSKTKSSPEHQLSKIYKCYNLNVNYHISIPVSRATQKEEQHKDP